ENVLEALHALAPDGADALVGTSGSRAAHGQIVDLLRLNGQAAILGLGSLEPSINPITFFGKQITMFGSNIYPEWMLPEIISFVHRRQVPPHRVITHRSPLSDAPAMFRLADSATAGKIVFQWE